MLEDILVLIAIAVAAIAGFRRLRLPSVLAYLLTGLVVGPHGLRLIDDGPHIALLAELGIVFMLFTIGLGFSPSQLLAMRRTLLRLGGLQVAGVTLLVFATGMLLGLSGPAALTAGAILAQSSSAIIGKQLAEQDEQRAHHGRMAIGVSLFQDIAAIPFVVILPALAIGSGWAVAGPLALALLKALAAFLLVFALGRWLLRPLLREIASARSGELFTLTAMLLALTAAWGTRALGLSLALGAFLAGMMLSETEFRHQIEGDIRPFRDVLLGLFFISIGMLLDLAALPGLWHWALLLALAIMILKVALIIALALTSGTELMTALRAGLVLAVGGEFGLALLAIALEDGLLTPVQTQLLLSSVLFSFLLAPLLIRYNGVIAQWICRRLIGPNCVTATADKVGHGGGLSNHVLICGYGRTGQSIGHVLEEEGLEFVAIDLDPVRVRRARLAGEPVLFGDAARHEMLQAAALDRARLLVVSFDDMSATLKILSHVRKALPQLPVLVRTRDEDRIELFHEAGATEVVPESLEAGLMLISHLLLALNLPMSRVVRRVREVRGNRYRLLRGYFHGVEPLLSTEGEQYRERLQTFTVPESAHAAGRSLEELELSRYQVLVTAVRRGGIRGTQPLPQTTLRPGDVLVLYGKPLDLERAEHALLYGT